MAQRRGGTILKEDDNAVLKKHRLITLLSHVYKLFLRVITNHLVHKFDNLQHPEESSFRKYYSTINQNHTLQQVLQKTEEYNE